MSITKKIIAWILAFCLVLVLIPQMIFAQEATGYLYQGRTANQSNSNIEVSITNLSKPDSEIYQGNNARVTFDFKIEKKNLDDSFQLDEKIEIETNIGELFTANWSDLSNIEIKDDSSNLLATVSITDKKITFVIKEGAVDSNKLSGQVISLEKLTAKDVGATEGKDVKKDLVVGNAKKEITFKYFNQPPILPSEKGPVDIDTSWKNAWSNNTKTGATTSIEVNPIGSMDLYGYYTYPENDNPNRNPQITSYDNFLVKDIIQDQGYIDKNSVKIYAAVPDIAVKKKDAVYNGWYKVPAGTYYAARQGTLRYRIERNTPEDQGRERLTYLAQKSNESYDDFYKRIVSSPLQWGIYYDSETDTETFLCNFGGIGHGDSQKNNGIKYSDYGIDSRGASLGAENFLSDNGPTAGNIVSYYIEYNAYYPEVKGVKNVDNSVECYNVKPTGSQRISGNTATFEINNGGGFGTIRKNELNLLLVDKDDTNKPIGDARFKLQKKEGNRWVDTGIEKATDRDGIIKVKNLPEGDYKIVQLSTAKGYLFDNNTYKESSNPLLQKVSGNGEFTISNDKSFGVGTIVTNEKKKYYTAKYVFKSKNGETLPSEVTSLLPHDTNKYYEGDTIKAVELSKIKVVTEDGEWKFNGFDATDKVVNKDIADAENNISFIGTWEFQKKTSSINLIPIINAGDKTLTVGDEFDPLKDVTATDKEDGDLTGKIEILANNVDTNNAGEYEITYRVTDSKGAFTIKTINVTVKAKETPIVPSEPTDPSKPNNPDDIPNSLVDDNNPQTGDNENLMLWGLLLITSSIGLISAYRKKRKITK